MAKATIKIPEPAVRIGRNCIVCGEMFILGHPSDPRHLCDRCRETLKEIILERQKEER